eukprot:CAMPEP_0171784682 /NCGR_PEP_ID=MMETSP0991-20121206/62228_1 /TAXON_ID=483369 /ORGANISM="non described non described, Strain CCMP2098" /LENGTH=62 /DNA_ID=CAMNT_0012393045 /DNA_START=583 /DNA_END=767 /DNA_ORIENTATION=+
MAADVASIVANTTAGASVDDIAGDAATARAGKVPVFKAKGLINLRQDFFVFIFAAAPVTGAT